MQLQWDDDVSLLLLRRRKSVNRLSGSRDSGGSHHTPFKQHGFTPRSLRSNQSARHTSFIFRFYKSFYNYRHLCCCRPLLFQSTLCYSILCLYTSIINVIISGCILRTTETRNLVSSAFGSLCNKCIQHKITVSLKGSVKLKFLSMNLN